MNDVRRADPGGSVYYRHSGGVPAASRLSVIARRDVYRRFVRAMAPAPGERILDIGVTSDTIHPESNFLEREYPYKHQLTCVGTEDGAHLERDYPGLRFVRIVPGAPLPFADRSFDVVFSNAVIEHVGGTAGQRAFVAEALRVSRRFFIATPNRLFPFETHTGLPLLHYLPPRAFRALLRAGGYETWAAEEQLNLLTAASLSRLFPRAVRPRVEYAGIGPGRFKSNLVIYGDSEIMQP